VERAASAIIASPRPQTSGCSALTKPMSQTWTRPPDHDDAGGE
jgi:hypothetical protein